MAVKSLESLKTEIIESLAIRLSGEASYKQEILEDIVSDAIDEIKKARRYPSNYSEEDVVFDLYSYKSQIKKLCLYDYSKDGADGQSIHSENGIYRMYEERNKCFAGVLPLCRT